MTRCPNHWRGQHKIRTSYVNPPIPYRSSDWQAVLDNYEPDDPVGYGATEEEAIADLLETIEGWQVLSPPWA